MKVWAAQKHGKHTSQDQVNALYVVHRPLAPWNITCQIPQNGPIHNTIGVDIFQAYHQQREHVERFLLPAHILASLLHTTFDGKQCFFKSILNLVRISFIGTFGFLVIQFVRVSPNHFALWVGPCHLCLALEQVCFKSHCYGELPCFLPL